MYGSYVEFFPVKTLSTDLLVSYLCYLMNVFQMLRNYVNTPAYQNHPKFESTDNEFFD